MEEIPESLCCSHIDRTQLAPYSGPTHREHTMSVASQSPVDLVADIPMRSCAICHCQDLWLFLHDLWVQKTFHDLPPSKSVGAVILHDLPLSRSVGAG